MRITLAVAAVLAMATASQAAIVAYEGFNYGVGGLNGQSGGGSFGFSGAWTATNANVAAGSMSYPAGTEAVPSGNSVQGTSMSAWRALDSSNWIDVYGGPDKTLYISVLARKTNGGASGDSLSVGFARSGTFDSGKLTGAVGYGSNDQPMLVKSGLLTGGSAYGLGYTAIDETRLFVLKLTVSNGNTLTYSIAALNGTPPEVPTWAVTQSWVFTATEEQIDRIGIFSGNNVAKIDEIRVGTTYQDVIPEPATLTLLGVGALALLRRRR